MEKIRNHTFLSDTYQTIRDKTEKLCKPLMVEDYITQSMEDVSPPKWHLAHTTWFFETFILMPYVKTYRVFDPLFAYLFNSYYNGVGTQYPRHQRGILSRPTVEMIYQYRKYVDEALLDLLSTSSPIKKLVELGLHHEQQHQELLLMDIKYNFFMNPHLPIYQTLVTEQQENSLIPKLDFYNLKGGLIEIGFQGNDFCYDNELPRHKKYVRPYQMANRLITNGEYLEFIEAGGYQCVDWWLVDGWTALHNNRWQAPLYWQKKNNQWYEFTLSGVKELNLYEPVTHVSYYEADAFANWKGNRLPTEEEWEHFVTINKLSPEQKNNFMENNILHPQRVASDNLQLFGDVWEWTSSEYKPYPGFKSLPGVLGEYNAKFMNNQKVLRGGCCVTPITHIRSSYRNFFACDKRWQFSGIRLAADK